MNHHKNNEEKANNSIIKQEDLSNLTEEELVDLINQMPPEHRRVVFQNVAMVERSEFSGPLPTPEHLKGYEECCPGAADRIISMAEKEQEHRLKRDDKVLDMYKSSEHKGLNFAFIVTMTFLISGVLTIYSGKNTQGFVILTPVIVQFFIHIFKNFKSNTQNSDEIEEEKDKKRDLD